MVHKNYNNSSVRSIFFWAVLYTGLRISVYSIPKTIFFRSTNSQRSMFAIQDLKNCFKNSLGLWAFFLYRNRSPHKTYSFGEWNRHKTCPQEKALSLWHSLTKIKRFNCLLLRDNKGVKSLPFIPCSLEGFFWPGESKKLFSFQLLYAAELFELKSSYWENCHSFFHHLLILLMETLTSTTMLWKVRGHQLGS